MVVVMRMIINMEMLEKESEIKFRRGHKFSVGRKRGDFGKIVVMIMSRKLMKKDS